MPTGKPAQIMDALFAHAALMESTGPTLPVSFPEPAQPFVPPADGKHLRVDYFPNAPAWQGVRSGKMDMGLLQVGVVWPRSLGLIAPAQAVGLVMTHFAKNTTLFSGTTKVSISGEPYEAALIEGADRITVPVVIPWMAV